MKASRPIVALLLSFAVLVQFVPQARACGPETIEPILVLQDSPDPPFKEFTQGKLGIVKPSFGRKTLTIAYRYLNGGSFNEEEQKGLVEALKGLSLEPDTDDAVKVWIAARKLVVKNETNLPDIYQDKSYGSFDFFPNCTSNAFEVATETLKDRVARYGSEDANVQEWLNGQDTVFHNCSSGSVLPAAVGAERPTWLRKDRDYQIAAAHFYSLKFEEARAAFRRIAEDAESDWQQTADYLVGRTMVRQASLESDESIKRRQYESAEAYLINLLGRAVKFREATERFLGLIKYRLRPEERVRELAQVLAQQSGNDNLRQDLIDYVWLLDKFDKQVQDAEAERLKRLNPPTVEPATATQEQVEWQKKRELVERGELIQFWLPWINADGQVSYSDSKGFEFKPDASETEILQTVETVFGRKLSEAETKQLWERHAHALQWRKFGLSPNRRFNWRDGYEGCDYQCNDLTLDLLPSFLKIDELNDWIFTFQSKDPQSYSHALTKWLETQSEPWFVAALSKANKTSPSLKRLLAQTQKIQTDSPVFATVAYNRVRLLRDIGKQAEARQLLDEIIETRLDTLPISAQNQFVEQRMELAQNITEFLKYGARKPVVFYEYGTMGRIADIMSVEKDYQEEQGLEQQQKRRIEQLLKWDERRVFDEKVVEILNWHFPLAGLVAASHDPALPDYLREQLLFTVWTRAVLLRNDSVAEQVATEIVKTDLDSSGVLVMYLESRTPIEKEDAATYAILKLPRLSPYLAPGLPYTDTEEDNYYFELAWWCTLPETEYDEKSNEVPKRVPIPPFLSADFLTAAQKERAELRLIGDAKKYLGKRVIAWAKQRPQDPRIPEALFVAAMANQGYKYGCGGWEHDDELRQEAEALLREKYPKSLWAVKLQELQQ